MKKLLIILCLFSSPVMAGEYEFKKESLNNSFQRYENEEAVCYRHHGRISCFKK